MWNQIYNPLGNAALSTIAAAIPVVTLLVLIASGKVKAHIAAIIAVILTNLIAIFIFTMPASMSIRASLLGVVSGFFPIGWIVLNVIFIYQLPWLPAIRGCSNVRSAVLRTTGDCSCC